MQELGWASSEWVSKRIRWERVDVGQAVVVFMMSDVLQEVCKGRIFMRDFMRRDVYKTGLREGHSSNGHLSW